MTADIGYQQQLHIVSFVDCHVHALSIKLDHMLACRYPSTQTKVQMASAIIKALLNLHSGG